MLRILLFALTFSWFGIGLVLAQKPAKTPKPSKFDSLVTISTPFGDMKLLLYERTPLHRSNFLNLAKRGFYNDLLFHRVIKNFMIQGGDPNSKNAPAGQMLGNGDVGYQVPAEFLPDLFHKKGVIAAARDNNPQKASSGCQFYIVQGKKLTDADLEAAAARTRRAIPPAQAEVYKTLGGTPHLDQNYTVYGEVISGLEVIDKVAEQATDPNDRPLKDVKMTVRVERVKKDKITKLYGYKYQ